MFEESIVYCLKDNTTFRVVTDALITFSSGHPSGDRRIESVVFSARWNYINLCLSFFWPETNV